MEFSIPSEFTVPSTQGPTIPENINIIIHKLQLIAIKQQPMVIGEERVLAKYQKNPKSPVLDLIANAVGETFLRRSPVIISSESDSPDSPSALSYTSESPVTDWATAKGEQRERAQDSAEAVQKSYG